MALTNYLLQSVLATAWYYTGGRYGTGALTAGVAASFGFDAITVALLGRSKPWGTFFAGLLWVGARRR